MKWDLTAKHYEEQIKVVRLKREIIGDGRREGSGVENKFSGLLRARPERERSSYRDGPRNDVALGVFALR